MGPAERQGRHDRSSPVGPWPPSPRRRWNCTKPPTGWPETGDRRDLCGKAGELAPPTAKPISDMRGHVEYRKHLRAGVLGSSGTSTADCASRRAARELRDVRDVDLIQIVLGGQGRTINGETPCRKIFSNVSKKSHVSTTINGEPVEFLCENRQSLLEVLRDVLRLTGSKEGCNNGNCGACTVLLDGCRSIAAWCSASRPKAPRSRRSKALPTRAACTRFNSVFGKRRAAVRHLHARLYRGGQGAAGPQPQSDEHDIRFELAGNLCRCTGYDKIVRAVQAAAKVLQEGRPDKLWLRERNRSETNSN